MAITRRYINLAMSGSDALSWLQAYLQTALVDTLGIAESVAIDELDDTKLIISGTGITVTLAKATSTISTITSKCLNDDSTKAITPTAPSSWSGLDTASYIMTTSTSALLLLTGTSYRYHIPIIFTKTNNGKMAVILSDTAVDATATSNIFPGGSRYYIFSGDDNTIQTVQRTYTVDKSQTTLSQVQIVPFITNPPIGSTSYTAGAYTATLSNVVCNKYAEWEDYILGDRHYLTNGGWWLKDDLV